MKKLIKRFFSSYEQEMSPDIDISIFKKYFSMNKYNYNKLYLISMFSIIPRYFILLSVLIIPVIIITNFPKYLHNIPYHMKLYDEIDKKYDFVYGEPLLKVRINKKENLYFYYVVEDNCNYIVFLPVTYNNYQVEVYCNSNIIFDIETNQKTYYSYYISHEYYLIEIIVYQNYKRIYYRYKFLDLTNLEIS